MVRQWAFLIACFAGLLIMGQWPTLWDRTRRMMFSTVDFVGNNHQREDSNIPKVNLSHCNEPWSRVSLCFKWIIFRNTGSHILSTVLM